MKYKNLMAKALYDNVPESPEELAFRKGDILTVIEQNTGGLEGWWLCSLHGHLHSLCSGTGAGERGHVPEPAAEPPPEPPQSLYQVPPRTALSVDNTPNKVVTPSRVGQSYSFSPAPQNQQDLYDVPPSRAQGVYDVPPGHVLSSPYPAQSRSAGQSVYDVPPSQLEPRGSQGVYDVPPSAAAQGVYSVPPCRATSNHQESNYDFPQPQKSLKAEGIYDIPPPALTKPTQISSQSVYDYPPSNPETSPSSSSSSTNFHNNNEGIYDVPPPALASSGSDIYDIPRGSSSVPNRASPNDSKGIYDVPVQASDLTDGVNRLSFSSTGSTRSSMSTSSSSTGSPTEGRLVLDLDSALQRLYRLQQSVEIAIGNLHTMAASPHWRTFAVRAAVADFVVFGRGAAANATALSDCSLHSKLRRQLARLEDSQQIVIQIYQVLDNSGWAINALASSNSARHNKTDDLDRFVMVSRTVPDDAKQLASTGKEDFERHQKALLEKENIIKQNQVQLGPEQINQFKRLEQEVSKPVENDISQWISHSLCSRDKQLLVFYSDQCGQHFLTLLSAMDAFFSCVSAGQPPRIFVAHSKFVILSAHKLVFIGDTLSRQVSTPELANRVMNASNVLCDLLKTVVGATKTAALNYPNTAAIQEMVDRVTELSQHSQQFKEHLLQMSQS
ncbi:hypothetical protein WMY93_019160 [Mugilogobius chulae]|uniref:SH3 domain-containing protein n=1 Tax=Mugilogobius chulae TaxID=88201 RepID=A0AAW0NPF1_9GOBI